MDINDFRAWHTLVLLILFVGIWVWAWSAKRKKSFNEAANLPFADDSKHEATTKKDEES